MSQITTKSPVRLSYTNLLVPRAQNDGDDPTYSTAILIPKSDTETLAAVREAIKLALVEATPKVFKGKTPPVSQLRNPLRDGDTDRPDDEVYKDHFFINAKGPKGGRERPVLLNAKGDETDSAEDIYSGVFATVMLQFYGYDVSGNKGIACGVAALQSTGEGEPLANMVTAASARAAFGISTPAESAKEAFAGASETTESEAAPAAADDVWGS